MAVRSNSTIECMQTNTVLFPLLPTPICNLTQNSNCTHFHPFLFFFFSFPYQLSRSFTSSADNRGLWKRGMCPLRLILIFLSASLAGFFVLRGLRSQPQPPDSDAASAAAAAAAADHLDPQLSSNPSPDSATRSAKALSAIGSGFRTFVDMASGRYLWTHLVSSSEKSH